MVSALGLNYLSQYGSFETTAGVGFFHDGVHYLPKDGANGKNHEVILLNSPQQEKVKRKRAVLFCTPLGKPGEMFTIP